VAGECCRSMARTPCILGFSCAQVVFSLSNFHDRIVLEWCIRVESREKTL
jgi:hypothetical protein